MKLISKTTLTSMAMLSTLTMTACSQQAEKINAVDAATAVVQEKTANVATATADAPAEPTKATEEKSGFSYTAIGNEPDWAVDVHADDSLTFSTPENMEGIKLTAERSAYAKGVEYKGTHDGKAFNLNLNGTSCNSTMSDKSYDMTATFEFDGKTYKGCATSKQSAAE